MKKMHWYCVCFSLTVDAINNLKKKSHKIQHHKYCCQGADGKLCHRFKTGCPAWLHRAAVGSSDSHTSSWLLVPCA